MGLSYCLGNFTNDLSFICVYLYSISMTVNETLGSIFDVQSEMSKSVPLAVNQSVNQTQRSRLKVVTLSRGAPAFHGGFFFRLPWRLRTGDDFELTNSQTKKDQKDNS